MTRSGRPTTCTSTRFGHASLAPSRCARHIHGEEVALNCSGTLLETLNWWLDVWITWIVGEKYLMRRPFEKVDDEQALESFSAAGRLSPT